MIKTKTHRSAHAGASVLKSLGLLAGSLVALTAASLEAQTTPGPQPSICNRACWVARAPNCNPGTIPSLNRAIIHHTAGGEFSTTGLNDSKARTRGIQNLDMDVNGWCDYSYHFAVDKYGNVFEGRSGAMSGLPKAYHDTCNTAFGFVLYGYFHAPNNNVAPQIMLDRLYDTIAWRMPSGWSPYGSGTYCGKTVGRLDGHRKVTATACPGDKIHPNLITENYNGGPMRTSVAARRGGTPPPPPPTVFMRPTWTSSGTSPSPATVNTADGRLEIIGIGTDSALRHMYETANNGPWSSWESFGGQYQQVVAGRHNDKRIEIFAIDANNAVSSIYQQNNQWNGPISFGGSMTSLSVGNNLDGRIELFATGTDGALWHMAEAANNGPWSSWMRFGETGLTKVAVGRHNDGRMEAFYIGANGVVGAYYQTSPNAGWAKSTTIPGNATMKALAVANNADGRLEIAGVGTDGALWHMFETSNNGPWSTWERFGESGLTHVVVWPHVGNRLEIFYLGANGMIGGYFQTAATGGSWAKSTNFPLVPLTSLAASSHNDGRIELFGRATDGRMHNLFESSPNGPWAGNWGAWASPLFK